MVAPGYGCGIVAMAALGYGGPQSWELLRSSFHMPGALSSSFKAVWLKHSISDKTNWLIE